MKRIAAIGLLATALTSCTTGQVDAVANALGVHLTPDQSLAVANHYNRPDPTDCNGAVAKVWPARLQDWARRIVWRESRNQPWAGASHASKGCFQIQLPLHNNWFTAVGCRPDAWANAMCNTRAAWYGYQQNGTNPWAATR